MAKQIWVVPQLREGQLTRGSFEAVAAAQRLAQATSSPAPTAVLIGHDLGGAAAEAARRNLSAVRVADHAALAAYTPGAWIGVLKAALAGAGERPDFVIFPHTYQTVDFVPRLAQTVDAALVPEATGFSVTDADGLVWTRPVLAGKLQSRVRVRGDGTALVSVQAGSFPADTVQMAEMAGAGGGVPVESLAVDAAAVRPDREVLGYEQVAAQQVDLTKADIVLALGRGVGGADKMAAAEELARELGAEIGASRPVIDSGWLPRERQIGSSGQTVAPRLYIAAGISGAIQHLVGMKGSSVVVAINKDPSAPIFSIADYGVVGDLHEVLPALTAAVRAARG